MIEPARRKATYQDLCNLPVHLVGEIVDGDLYASPRPTSDHANASSVLGVEIGGPFHRRSGGPGGPGGWWILDEPELHLGDDVVVPDLAGWRRERMPRRPRAPFFTLAPDWVCEVLSPATLQLDRVKKKRIYAREGVEYLWFIDPDARTMEVFHRAGDFWQETGAYAEDERVSAPPFDAIEIQLARLWEEE